MTLVTSVLRRRASPVHWLGQGVLHLTGRLEAPK